MPSSAEPGSTVRPATPADWQQAFALLDVALDLKPADRATWLARQEPQLVPVLETLLRDDAQLASSGFLDSSPQAVPDAMPTTVGPYRLLREIGQGGMASVWLAERADGLLERRVALKLPHASWGGGLAERMARERSILAGLTHPNIARLYDAGIADDGRPYLALEYIDGQPIDVHAAARGLGLRERIELLVQAARAVAHAHAQLVVHRDLKPSNILVDAQGRAHLLDFGIAKLVDAPVAAALPDAAATVAFGRVLTPDYASPEQIRGEPIGTGSDVYSLGVVAFELLAGARPYRLRAATEVGLVAALAQVSPPRASAVAADESRRRALRGDLDAILAHCLAPTPAERYPTMAALADDLQRHLRGEPVRARPPARLYVAERWVRRHAFESAVGAAVLLALAGGQYAQVLVLLALAVGAIAALWQRNVARRQAELARAALARGEQVKAFVASIFTQAVPRAGAGGAVAAADLLRAAAQRIETDLAGQPAVAAELAALIGDSYNELGELHDALAWLPKAVALCTRELGATHPLTLKSRWRWAEAANSTGQLAVAQPLLPPLVRDLRAAQPPQPALLARALQSQAFGDTKHGREAQALAALEEAVAVATQAFGEAADETLDARSALSNTLGHFGRDDEALRAIAPALPHARAAYAHQRPHPMLAMIELNHGNALARVGRPREAAAMLRQVLADQQALDAGETHRMRVDMAILGYTLTLCGRYGEAKALIADALAMHRRLTDGINHEAAQMLASLALANVMQGEAGAALAHADEADRIMQGVPESAVRTQQRMSVRAMAQALDGPPEAALHAIDALLQAAEPPTPPTRMRLRRHRLIALRRAGRWADARAEAAEARSALTAEQARSQPLEHGLLWAESARCLQGAGATGDAAALYREALQVWAAGQVDGDEALAPVRAELDALTQRG